MSIHKTTSTLREYGADHPVLSLACSFLAGAALGAGLGLLAAPQSGRETRADITARARRGRERAAEAMAQGRAAADRARVLVEDERGRAARVVGESREAMADIRARGERALQAIGTEAVGAVADVKAAGRDVRATLRGQRDGVVGQPS